MKAQGLCSMLMKINGQIAIICGGIWWLAVDIDISDNGQSVAIIDDDSSGELILIDVSGHYENEDDPRKMEYYTTKCIFFRWHYLQMANTL